ncbi:TPA: hypothetical protein JAJ28_001959 [Aeromonas hydrophila]|uniref:Uncharacterized protein n=1 Tax=Aeromonas hydrophila TaxID=644 RepID=A0AAD3UAL1_AERHY|nr:hypothetical protein [Aeromonas hydrophila]
MSPPEVADAGFYLFYYLGSNESEFLIYSSDYGDTAKKTILNKGTVSRVLDELLYK